LDIQNSHEQKTERLTCFLKALTQRKGVPRRTIHRSKQRFDSTARFMEITGAPKGWDLPSGYLLHSHGKWPIMTHL
jgi:hypothetical protein